MDDDLVDRVRSFRVALHACFGRRRDALFELVESLLTGVDAGTRVGAGAPPSVAYLSLGPRHRRGWGSAYAALRRGEVDGVALRSLLARQFALPSGSGDGAAPNAPLDFAVDVSTWPRRNAATSPERGYWDDHAGSRGPRRLPVAEGWAYQWVARLGPHGGGVPSSWTAPVDVRRVRPSEAPVDTAIAQLRDFASLVAPAPLPSPPLFTFDAGYDSAYLSDALADTPEGQVVALLVRLRRHRCFFMPPPGSDPRAVSHLGGARRLKLRGRGAAKFSCADPTTWPPPTAVLRCTDAAYGRVEVRAWAGLYAPLRRPPRPGFHGRDRRAVGPRRGLRRFVRGTVLRVQVQRLHGGLGRRRPVRRTGRTWAGGPAPDALWLWWRAPGCDVPTADALDRCWRAYARRFDIEQTFRFLKQRLGWTTPRVRLPEQADRWSWLVAAAFAQLLLVRSAVADQRLPWERALPPDRLTPTRVLRAFVPLAHRLPRVAATPRPCGRSPGRPKGRRSRPAPRYPPLKKAA